MDRILLHIRKKIRREALSEALSGEFEVAEGNPADGGPTGDLLILDYPTYQRGGSTAIKSFKSNEEAREVLPVLLLVPPDWMSSLDDAVWTRIDEVLEMPIRLPELKGRIRSLLGWRRSSSEARRYQDLYKEKGKEAARYRAAFDEHPLPTLLARKETIVRANRRAEHLFRTPAQKLRGRALDSITPEGQLGEELPAGLGAGLLGSGAGEEGAGVKCQFERPDGGLFEAQFAANVVVSGGETYVQVVFYEHQGIPVS